MHVLLPCFLFPPFCAPGSMRLGRFVRHFAERGARVTVVTAAVEDFENEFPRKQNLDYALLDGLHESVEVVRTPPVRQLADLSKGGPDSVVCWNPAAAEACSQLHAQRRFDVLYTSSNPLSGHLLGKSLSERLSLPWIAEFRDPWTTSPFRSWESVQAYQRDCRLHESILRTADRVVVNTPVGMADTKRKYPFLDDSRISVVTNSFDRDGGVAVNSRESRPDRLLIAHVGTLRRVAPTDVSYARALVSALRKRLTSGQKPFTLCETNTFGNSVWYIAEAFCQLVKEDSVWRDRIRLELVGRFGIEAPESRINALCNSMGIQGMIHYGGLVPHVKALQLTHAADLLLVNQEYPIDGRPCSVVPAKVYEYIASQRPILGLLPTGDARSFIEEAGTGFVCAPDDPLAAAELLRELYLQHSNGGIRVSPTCGYAARFDSRHLAEKVLQLLKTVVSEYNGTSPVSRGNRAE